jgi:acetyl-CoA synthase
MEEGKAYPLGIVVDVAGRKMERDFEGILERRLHNFLGEIMGIFHMGQRNMNWIRISKEARKAGFKIRHFGVVIRAKLLSEFPAIVDKVQVTLYTTQEGVEKVLPEAQKAYQYRDERVKGLTDESVDTFYSCTLCQSYAPNHVCIISPERLGLCGAYNWLDGKASYEINPHGPNQPVVKGKCLDPIKGQWEGINKFVYEKSNKSIERFNAYSIMEYPMSSCGCFECIVVIIPEGNGFMVVNREYPHETPCGMPFSTLAGQVGGGSQTPGFLGVGKLYLTSRKFISAEGGLKRLLWMPQELKETLGEALREACQRTGVENLYEKIATEKDAHTVEELISFLEKVSHPALTMEPLM